MAQNKFKKRQTAINKYVKSMDLNSLLINKLKSHVKYESDMIDSSHRTPRRRLADIIERLKRIK